MDKSSNDRSEMGTPAMDGESPPTAESPAGPPPAGADPSSGGAPVDRPHFGHLWRGPTRPVLYPNEYVWFVFFSSLDVMLTWAILKRDGAEVNPIAKYVIDLWGLNGAIAFKFSLMIFVIIVCEIVGRTRPAAARRLIRLCIFVSALPVTWSLLLLLVHTYGMDV